MHIRFVAAAALLLATSIAWSADQGVRVVTVAEKEVRVVDEEGQETTRLEPVATVIPGDQILYTIRFDNRGAEPAERVVITDPVPPEMTYVAGSAFGPGTDISFSVDGGVSWGTPETLFVTGDDGRRRLADAGDYTHIRWAMRSLLKPGGAGVARFRAELR